MTPAYDRVNYAHPNWLRQWLGTQCLRVIYARIQGIVKEF